MDGQGGLRDSKRAKCPSGSESVRESVKFVFIELLTQLKIAFKPDLIYSA